MNKPMNPREWIEHLMTLAFAEGRTPRSEEYKLGVRALLTLRFTMKPMTCPHKAGTAAYDAFFAGVSEGCSIWADHIEQHRPVS
ncbi:hypothetical protein [Duganella sp.]|uniref:hypothetical protein n=1 Tax=Duganella sp. TaxID=1904440 RepID=UPI0031E1F989